MENSRAPACSAVLACSAICRALMSGYSGAVAWSKWADCEQKPQFSGQWPLLALTMPQSETSSPWTAARTALARASSASSSGPELWWMRRRASSAVMGAMPAGSVVAMRRGGCQAGSGSSTYLPGVG